MKELIMKMVKENVWIQIQKDFYEFTMKHCKKLSLKEQICFVKMINSGDEYSLAILNNLWQEFQVEGFSEERVTELFNIEVTKMGNVIV
jgi:hypothetical protein